MTLIGVLGNNDFYHPSLTGELLFDLEGVRVLICHGHQYFVKRTTDNICYRAVEKDAKLVLFGHTHCAERISENGVLLFNPGAVKDGRFGIVHIKDGIVVSADSYFWDFQKGKIV